MSTVDATGVDLDRGLSAAEADARRRRGEANTAVSGATRSYASILRTNVLNFFNIILFVIGVALLALGRYSDALVSVGLGLINAAISATQEIRAKRKLDRLQLLDRAPVRALRDGTAVELARRVWSAATCCSCRRATRSSSTGRCFPIARWRPTSRCSPASPTPWSSTRATTCGRAACAWRVRVASSRGTSAWPATPDG